MSVSKGTRPATELGRKCISNRKEPGTLSWSTEPYTFAFVTQKPKGPSHKWLYAKKRISSNGPQQKTRGKKVIREQQKCTHHKKK